MKEISVAGLFMLLTTIGSEAQPIGQIQLNGTSIPQVGRLENKLARFTGREFSEVALEEIAQEIVRHHQTEGQPVVLVELAPELSETGILMVAVEQGTIGKSKVTGGLHLHTQPWQQAAADLSGKPVDGVAVQSLLDWIQRNPLASNTTLAASPGASATEANLDFTIPNQSAWQGQLSFANDGVEPLGAARWRAGWLWGNAFGSGQQLAGDVSMGTTTKAYLAESLSWTIPLPHCHEATISLAHASTAAELTGVNIGGDAWLASLRYTVPWRTNLQQKNAVYFGADYRYFDTDLTFGGLGTFSQPLETGTLVAGANTNIEKGNLSSGAMLEAVWSPGGLFANGTDEAYAEVTEEASSRYFVLRSGLWSRWDSPSAWTLQGRVSGQWADGPLLPAEEATVTGMAAVRGYPERSLLASQAAWGSLELFAPPVAGKFRLMSFVDAGQTWSPHEPAQTAASVGLGIHAAWKSSQLKCEVAWPLQDLEDHANSGPRLHLTASFSF